LIELDKRSMKKMVKRRRRRKKGKMNN